MPSATRREAAAQPATRVVLSCRWSPPPPPSPHPPSPREPPHRPRPLPGPRPALFRLPALAPLMLMRRPGGRRERGENGEKPGEVTRNQVARNQVASPNYKSRAPHPNKRPDRSSLDWLVSPCGLPRCIAEAPQAAACEVDKGCQRDKDAEGCSPLSHSPLLLQTPSSFLVWHSSSALLSHCAVSPYRGAPPAHVEPCLASRHSQPNPGRGKSLGMEKG